MNTDRRTGKAGQKVGKSEPRLENKSLMKSTAVKTARPATEVVHFDPPIELPRILTLGEPEKATGLRCFVVLPFRERESNHSPGFFGEVLDKLIVPAGQRAGFTVTTAKKEGCEIIHSTIVNDLLDADIVIADLTEHNPNVLFELGMRMAHDKPVVLIRAKGTGQIFDVDNLLRVLDYDPNLWGSSVELDMPRLAAHIESTWRNREKEPTYVKLLRRNHIGNEAMKPEVQDIVSQDSGIIGRLLETTRDEISRAIRLDDHGFTLANPVLAIYSYVTFWELLLDEQKLLLEEHNQGAKALNVEVIHSCEIDIWANHPLTKRLIDRQKQFTGLGGTITRVLCGRGKRPSGAFVRAYKNMLKANINVRYYNIDDGLIDHHFAWDFLRVRETGQAVIWAAFTRGEVIEKAVYTNSPKYEGKHLEKMWKEILNHSIPFPTNSKKGRA